MEEMLYKFLSLFFTAAYFHLALVAASISHFVTAATKFSSCSSNKKCLLRFFISRSKSLSPFFSLSFAGLPPTFSFSLSFSCSVLQICGHDNLSKPNTLNREHGYSNNFRFPFSSLLTLLLSLLYKKPVAMWFSAKITLSCIWVAIPVDWVILHWYACGADRRSLGQVGGQSVYSHMITKFSRMGRLLHFLTHGALLACFVRESTAIKFT